MARIPGVEAGDAGWLTRIAYYFTKRKFRRVVFPMKVHAHHPGLFRSMVWMETGQMGAKSVDAILKSIAQIKVAMLIGCPF